MRWGLMSLYMEGLKEGNSELGNIRIWEGREGGKKNKYIKREFERKDNKLGRRN